MKEERSRGYRRHRGRVVAAIQKVLPPAQNHAGAGFDFHPVYLFILKILILPF